MATRKSIRIEDPVNRADELAERAAAIAWLMAVCDDNETPTGTMQRAAEQVAEMIEELGECARQLASRQSVAA